MYHLSFLHTRTLQIVTIVLLIAIGVVALPGCLSVKFRDFRPLEQESPIIMFDRYEVSIWGYASTNHNTFINVSYLHELRDTSHIDTLPIFTIDTVCFYGDCLDSPLYVRPRSWTEELEQYSATWYPRQIVHEAIRSDDLFFKDSLVVPSGFEIFDNAYSLPEECTDSSITVELWGRLTDRTTGIDVGRQRKRIRFMITPHTRRYMFSKTSERHLGPAAADRPRLSVAWQAVGAPGATPTTF